MEDIRLILSQHVLSAALALGVAGGLAYLWLQDRARVLKAVPVKVRRKR